MNGALARDIQRRIGFPWSLEMVERSRRSVGATLAAARVAVDDGVSANLAGGTHHAFADRGEGFCVFNDVAVAARVLQRDHHANRIAIIDLDVHQETAPRRSSKSMRRCSRFRCIAKRLPVQKEISDLDVPLPDGTGDGDYLPALRLHLDDVLNRHRPDFVFYLAGADPFEGDRLGRLKLTIDGLRARDEMVLRTCARAGLPVAISMSGGYAADIGAIVTIPATPSHSCKGKWLNTFAS